MTSKIIRFLLLFQGGYYTLTGAWALINIASFSEFTRYHGDFFLKYTNALLFLVVGLGIIYLSRIEILYKKLALIVAVIAMGIASIEYFYLPQIGNPFPFWIDFAEETLTAALLVLLLFYQHLKKGSNPER